MELWVIRSKLNLQFFFVNFNRKRPENLLMCQIQLISLKNKDISISLSERYTTCIRYTNLFKYDKKLRL